MTRLIVEVRSRIADRLLIWGTWLHPIVARPNCAPEPKPEPSPARRFLIEKSGPGLRSWAAMDISLIPETGELGFAWATGVGWTITATELMVVFERAGYVDPFTGQYGPEDETQKETPGPKTLEVKPRRQTTPAPTDLESRGDA